MVSSDAPPPWRGPPASRSLELPTPPPATGPPLARATKLPALTGKSMSNLRGSLRQSRPPSGARTAPPATGQYPVRTTAPRQPIHNASQRKLERGRPRGPSPDTNDEARSKSRTSPPALGYRPVRTTSPPPQLGLRISGKSARSPCVGDNAALITPSSGESDEVASSDWEVDVQLVRSLRQRRVLRVRGRRRPHRDITRKSDDAPDATSKSHAGWCED